MCVCLQERKFSISITVQEWSVGVLLKCLKSRSCTSSGRGTREETSRCSNFLGDSLSDNWKNNNCSFFSLGKCFTIVMQHIERGKPCGIYMCLIYHHDNGQRWPCSLLFHCFLEQVFQKSWVLFIEGRHQPTCNIKLTIILTDEMRHKYCSFCKVPPFNVLHHNNYFMTS